MVSAFTNSLKIPELRERIFFTLAMIVIVRIGAAITLPGVDAHVLQEWLSNEATRVDQSEGAAQLAAMLSVFSGGALQNCAVFALGIMPYISASIMLQLLTAVVPRLSKLAREDGGRQKINQYTRLVTIVLCLFQGGMLVKSLQGANPNNPFLNNIGKTIDRLGGRLLVPDGSVLFVISTIFVITAGTLLLMWLGEQITERGIGNGISLIICINIVGDLPGALVQVWKTFINPENPDDGLSPIKLVILIAFLIIVIAAIIALTQAQRRVPVHYAKRVIGRKMMGGQTTFLPMKVNYAGVMPIIFASAILLFPSQVLQMMGFDWAKRVADWMSPQNWYYYAIEGLLIFFFSYFWVATMFQPNQIAEDLKKNGGYIPGVRPGKPTAEFLDYTMGRLTFAGAIFLTIVAILPAAMSRQMNVPPTAAQFFGGTSVLILVGVLLDVMRQVETHLIQRHYDGFLRKGKLRGRFERQQTSGKTASPQAVIMLWVLAAILMIFGVAYSIYKGF